MGVEPEQGVSPGVLRKIVYAGTHATSFRQASRDLGELAEAAISDERVLRATERIGQERVAQRDADVGAWQRLNWPQRDQSPTGQAPPVACVQVDGGRVQIRDGQPTASPEGRGGRFWRESKVACLLSLASQTQAEDPCPQLPEAFANFARMARLTREIKGAAPLEAEPSEEVRPPEEAIRPGRPEVLVRSVVATRRPLEEFGPLVTAAAWQRGFAAAPRKAFVADGASANWSLWQRHFSHYTPILDFVHAASYVFRAAAAGRPLDEAVTTYHRWAQAVWSGRVDLVLEELQQRQAELGLPQAEEAEASPRCILAESLRYLQNQSPRMRYDEYRRLGLPITTAHIESTIKQVNRRVKGTEKFWNPDGAEALLQLQADYLSDTRPLDRFWRERPRHATGRRRYALRR